MTILVTGGAGYIGSVTTRKLLERGHQVFVYDNLSTGFREAIPPGAEFVFGDVRDKDLLARVIKDRRIQAVVHFAAKLVVPESVEKPWDYYDNNVGGVLATVRASLDGGVGGFVFSSTAAVYGNPGPEPVEESTPVAPLNPYGASKWMAEEILRDVGRSTPLRHVILRYFNVAGAMADLSAGQRTKQATHLVKVAAEAATGRRPLVQITGTDFETPDGTGIRDYIHVEDLADAHVLAVEHLDEGGESLTLNCAYGQGASVREVIAKMREVSGRDFRAEEAPRRAGDAACITASGRKLREVFGWQPRFADLTQICKTAYEWEKKLQEET